MIVCVAVLSFYYVVTYYFLKWDIFQLVGHQIVTTSDLLVRMGHGETPISVGIGGLCVNQTPQMVKFHTDYVAPFFALFQREMGHIPTCRSSHSDN